MILKIQTSEDKKNWKIIENVEEVEFQSLLIGCSDDESIEEIIAAEKSDNKIFDGKYLNEEDSDTLSELGEKYSGEKSDNVSSKDEEEFNELNVGYLHWKVKEQRYFALVNKKVYLLNNDGKTIEKLN